ncbi:unnamed protein product [Amaranthus hypochondriacus]
MVAETLYVQGLQLSEDSITRPVIRNQYPSNELDLLHQCRLVRCSELYFCGKDDEKQQENPIFLSLVVDPISPDGNLSIVEKICCRNLEELPASSVG